MYASLALTLWLVHRFVVPLPASDPLGHSLLGVALGLLIVFRTNTSYDRYWDARPVAVGRHRHRLAQSDSQCDCRRRPIRAAGAPGGRVQPRAKQYLRGDRDLKEIESLVTPEVYRRATAATDPPAVLACCASEWIDDRLQAGELDSSTARGLESSLLPRWTVPAAASAS